MIDLYPELTKLQKMWKSGEYTELDECNLLKQHCERCICKANMKMNFAIVEECNYLMRDINNWKKQITEINNQIFKNKSNMKTIIEIEEFCEMIKCTNCILYSDEEKNIDLLKEEFCQLANIKSFEGNDYRNLSKLTNEFVNYLINFHGFKELKTNKIYFCD